MGLLTRDRSANVRSARIFALVGLIALAGCMVLDRFHSRDEVLGFSHRIHVEEEGMECLDCHLDAETADDVEPPRQALCMLCHADLDEGKPPERQAQARFVEGEFVSAHAGRPDGDVIFSHSRHAASRDDCNDCHGGIASSESSATLVPLSMDDCRACHQRSAVVEDCAACHREIRDDAPPTSHEHNWTRIHGQVVRSGSELVADRCTLCHVAQNDCISCHMVQQPQNHTNYWRLRGHAVMSSLDRASCATCHRSDFCSRCHAATLPLSHRGTWGSPRDNHCVACHFPLKDEGCFTCHKGTPSHLQAPRRPADPTHMQATDAQCRACHAPNLQHVDNGDSCRLCH